MEIIAEFTPQRGILGDIDGRKAGKARPDAELLPKTGYIFLICQSLLYT